MGDLEQAKLVAIVDDDDSVRAALQSLMKAVGLQTRGFESAEDFLNSGLLDRTACLITDIRMPGMSGLELQDKLNAGHCRVPTIFITAQADPEMRLQAMRAGALNFLTKPFDDDALLDTLARFRNI